MRTLILQIKRCRRLQNQEKQQKCLGFGAQTGIILPAVDKMYHCPKCKGEFTVKYRNDNDGITYFSKSRIAAQKKVYEDLGLDFPANWELMEQPFTYHIVGVCSECAKKDIMESQEDGQHIYNLCHELHMQDELMAAKAKKYMTNSLQKWLDGITESSYLMQFDLST